jgi:hypothetical protein
MHISYILNKCCAYLLHNNFILIIHLILILFLHLFYVHIMYILQLITEFLSLLPQFSFYPHRNVGIATVL